MSQIETRTFETEIQQLLHLIIHSLYSHKEIFIRELVSNASDAIDKARFLSLTQKELLGDDSKFRIQITLDPKAGTFTIADNGIGMNKEELIQNIGTIARSGSKAFLQTLSGDQKKDMSLIGQFGVGFYSVFMVADKVTLQTQKAGETEAWSWESDGKGSYTLAETSKKNRGTEIVLHLNEEGKEFLEDWQVRSVIRKFSDYITYDIWMPKLDLRPEEEKNKTPKPLEFEVINSGKALWARPKNEITEAMYEEFYKHISHDFEAPLAKTHFSQEGLNSFHAILFLPKKAPFDLFQQADPKGLQLYVKRVFITDQCKELIPNYLRFVRGIVDTEDLPLNVSREMLQHNKVMETIKKNLIKKVLELLKDLAQKDPEQYYSFWKEFGSALKEGIHFDHDNREKIADLLLFQSSVGKDEKNLVSLKDYIARMKKEQKDIYFITAETRAEAIASPHLEVFHTKNIEVLYLVDPVDEWVTGALPEYEGKKLVSIAKGELDLGELDSDGKKDVQEAEKNFKGVVELFRKLFQEEVKAVRATKRLTESPCCLVADSEEMGAHMERLLKRANPGQIWNSKKILEINPDHPVIRSLQIWIDQKTQNPDLENWARLLYDQALLAQGSKVSDLKAFNTRMNQLLLKAVEVPAEKN
jgi:molecular chaperone HtpG